MLHSTMISNLYMFIDQSDDVCSFELPGDTVDISLFNVIIKTCYFSM